MKNKHLKNILAGIAILALAACNLPIAATQSLVMPTSPIVPVTGATLTPAATVIATATEIPATEPPLPPTDTSTLTLNVVTVTAAANGSLGILRGPSKYYDTLGYLQNGQSSNAGARNSDGTWLYIYVPNYPTVFGWAYVGSQYSTVEGDVNSLPIKLVDPAVPAYIRNCTFHPMLIQPGGILLQPQTSINGRKGQFPPGTYSAYDQSVKSKKPVFSITLKEGVSVDIHTDGLKNTYTCP
jgi:hypothetical protein